MLIIPTYLDKSLLDGLGLFAARPISRGTIVWKLIPGFDVPITENLYKSLPAEAQFYLDRYSYIVNGIHWLCGDDARFINHSVTPNLDGTDFLKNMAIRDIEKGEEITINYYEFDENPLSGGELDAVVAARCTGS